MGWWGVEWGSWVGNGVVGCGMGWWGVEWGGWVWNGVVVVLNKVVRCGGTADWSRTTQGRTAWCRVKVHVDDVTRRGPLLQGCPAARWTGGSSPSPAWRRCGSSSGARRPAPTRRCSAPTASSSCPCTGGEWARWGGVGAGGGGGLWVG